MFDIVTFGGVTQDNFMKIAPQSARFVEAGKSDANYLCFEYGAKIEVDDAFSSVGGGALNAALSYKRLGFSPAVVSAVGADHYGKNILSRLAENDITDRFVARVAGVHTGLSVIVSSVGGDRTVFVYRGANDAITRDKLPSFHELQAAQWFSVSHLSGKSDKLLNDILQLKKENPKIRIAWNPGLTQLAKGVDNLKEFLSATKVLVVNRRESEILSKKTADRKSDKALKKIAEYLSSCGPEIVVISDGSNGSIAYSHHSVYSANTFPANIVNTTGAGDAFLAGFVAGLHYGRDDIEVALTYGSANAAGVVARTMGGDGHMTLKEIQEKVQRAGSFRIKKERV